MSGDLDEAGVLGRVDRIGTVIFIAALALGVVDDDGAGAVAVVTVSVAMLVAGSAAFASAFLTAAERSRTEELAVANAFLLVGSAPRAVQLEFWGLLAVQLIASITAASLRPFTAVAFGILAPVFGLGLMAMWGARHGRFGPRRRAGGSGGSG